MTDINENKYAKLFNSSLDFIDHIMNTNEALTEDDRTRMKAANSIIGSYPRYRQAQASTAGVVLEVLKGASETQEQYRELVRSHMPRMSPLITIPQILDSKKPDVIELRQKVQDLTTAIQVKTQEFKDREDEYQFQIMQLQEKAAQK